MKNCIKHFIILCLHVPLSASLYAAADVLTADITTPTFNLDCKNGKIDLHINGGFTPYDVVWYRVINGIEMAVQGKYGVAGTNDGEDLANVLPGMYKVEVTDYLCGKANAYFLMPRCQCATNCTINATITNAVCSANGKIEVEIDCPEIGHEPFKYKWGDKGAIGNYRGNLSPGVYCVTTTDADNCTYDKCFEVGGDGALQVVLAYKQNVSICNDSNLTCDGILDVEVIKGAGGYTYQWSNGATTQDINNLCPGTYTVTVTDLAQCTNTQTFELCCCNETVEIEPGNFNTQKGNCYAEGIQNTIPLTITGQAYSTNKMIETEIFGGTKDYTCVWQGPNGYIFYGCVDILSGLELGQYCLTVFDGCSQAEACFDIVDCSLQTILVDATIVENCTGLSVGSIELNITGGTSPYNVSWNSNNKTGPKITDLYKGTYCATILDKNGCTSGPHCFYVAANEPVITTTSEPCQKITTCNGIDYITNYDVEGVIKDCNYLDVICTANNDVISTTYLGYAGEYVNENCEKIGICQDGNEILLQYSFDYVNEFKLEKACEANKYICLESACEIDGVYYGNFYCADRYEYSIYDWESQYYCDEGLCYVEYVCSWDVVETDCVPCNSWKNQSKPNHTKNGVNLYPNPSTGILLLQFNTALGNLNIKVFDVLGREQYTETVGALKYNTKQLDLSVLPSGMYYVYLLNEHKTIFVEKIIIQ